MSESSIPYGSEGDSALATQCASRGEKFEHNAVEKEMLNGAGALIRCLLLEGVKVIFGYPGGAIMPVYDALYDYHSELRHILVRHEQGAAHAAEGYARVTGRPGVCIATSGPGATNLVTGIADAMLDSVPIVCITGQVSKTFLGTDAFQETDIIGITTPITKWNYQVVEAHEIPSVVAKAFHIASVGRPGPVLIDITKNAQVERFVFAKEDFFRVREKLRVQKSGLHEEANFDEASQILNRSNNPLILVGHGILISKAEQELKTLAERGNIPVASTLHGLSGLDTSHPLYVGMLGMHGNYGPNFLTNEADVILAIGMRFDDRVTGALNSYARGAKVIHIEIDPAEINKNVHADVPILMDAKEALKRLIPLVVDRDRSAWLTRFRVCDHLEHEKVSSAELYPTVGKIKMGEVVRMLSELSAGHAVIVADVGQHQMIAARYSKFRSSDSFITSGGLGTMGFALPAAIGAKVGRPDRTVVAIIGDGGFQMTLQELATIAQEDVPVKVVILNNSFLGMVRQWQELFFERRYSFVEMKNPDFVKIAEGFGVRGARVSEREELKQALVSMLESPCAFILEVVVEKEANVFPMVPAGASVRDVRLE